MSKIVIIGVGGVAMCILEMLQKTPLGITLLEKINEFVLFDKLNKVKELVPYIKLKKLKFIQLDINEQNINLLLEEITPRSIVIDVSYNIYFKPILEHCIKTNSNYINTSVERWQLKDECDIETNFIGRTLHEMHKEVFELRTKHPSCSTIIMVHGMNPGLITYFSFLGLRKVAEHKIKSNIDEGLKNKLKSALENRSHKELAYLLKLRTIHCSELDTQTSDMKFDGTTFINTWGCYSFYSEAVDPVQLGFGTHEKSIPNSITSHGTDNQVYLPFRGMDYISRSYLPVNNKPYKINGMLIPHSENDTLSLYLSHKNYRPSVYYVYYPCKLAMKSIDAVRTNGYEMLPNQYALKGTDIRSGSDTVGATLFFEDDTVFWSGTILSIEQTRKMGLFHSNPTVTQVGASLLSALKYIMKNPEKGILFPEDIDNEDNDILSEAIPYLGTIFTDFINVK